MKKLVLAFMVFASLATMACGAQAPVDQKAPAAQKQDVLDANTKKYIDDWLAWQTLVAKDIPQGADKYQWVKDNKWKDFKPWMDMKVKDATK